MRNLVIFSLLLIGTFAQAQVKFFVEASGNHALISKSQLTSTTEIESSLPGHKAYRETTYKAKYTNKFGGGITAGINYFFQENLSLDAGIGFNNINFSQETSNEFFEYYLPLDQSIMPTLPHQPNTSQKSEHSQILLSLPLSLSYYLLENDLAVSLGALPGFLLYSKGGFGASAEFNKFQMGIQLQLRYQFMPQWWFAAGFQEYSTKLYKPELKQSFSNLRLIKVGLKYDF